MGAKETLQLQVIHKNLSVSQLVEKALTRNEAVLTHNGALSVATGSRTGRSPQDRFIVRDPEVEELIDWGNVNQPIAPERFDRLLSKVEAYLKKQDEIFEFRGYVGADQNYRLPLTVVNEYAWQNLFAHQLFIRPTAEELSSHSAEFTVIAAPGFQASPKEDGTNSEAFVLISFAKKMVLIGGTAYAGEIKKAMFSVMNFLLPPKGVLSMHCSANIGEEGDTALFFGLSGTGKTTLSADPKRRLIGDDEHGWTPWGLFNLEGGCYAKCINLSAEHEPQIYGAIRFGAVLENIILDDQRMPDYTDSSLTENTRSAYPLSHIANALIPSESGHPTTVVFLTADAFGVLPPISILDSRQAMYHFLSGYTSKLAGTECGIKEPQATFSPCFGGPFLPLDPCVYAKLLGEKILEHNARVFLINTGWTGGGYGVGDRISLKYTRAMVSAALSGALDDVPTRVDSLFNLRVPLVCPDVPCQILDPRSTWQDQLAYQRQAQELAKAFQENFSKFSSELPGVAELGPMG